MGPRRVRNDDETVMVGLGGALLPRANPGTSGWVSRGPERERDSEVPTREMEGGVVGYVSRIDEIRRLYAEGSMDGQGGIQSGLMPACLSKTSAMCPPPSRTVTRRWSFSIVAARRPRKSVDMVPYYAVNS